MTTDKPAESTIPAAHIDPIKYAVSCLPEGHPARRHFTIHIEYRGGGVWAVTDGFGKCLDKDGAWHHESLPSNREDEWLVDHRFVRTHAFNLARQAAERIVVNGRTVADVLAVDALATEPQNMTFTPPPPAENPRCPACSHLKSDHSTHHDMDTWCHVCDAHCGAEEAEAK